LHFWAAREVGLFEGEKAAFGDYYVRFIGHFVSVYEASVQNTKSNHHHLPHLILAFCIAIRHSCTLRKFTQAPPFARESMRWSADPENIARYKRESAYPAKMPGVIGLSTREAIASLPEHERSYTGSRAAAASWPYELMKA